MDLAKEFLNKLKESIEDNSKVLMRGELFNPEYLRGHQFVNTFDKVAKTLKNKIDPDAKPTNLIWQLEQEVNNFMPEGYDIGRRQRIDYVFYRNQYDRVNQKPTFYFELESLDRSQLYVFNDLGRNKLRYYYGSIIKHDVINKMDSVTKYNIPRYFVWLLILPDKAVANYPVWDMQKLWGTRSKEAVIFHSSLKKLLLESPFRFYDHLIKSSARLFIRKNHYFDENNNKSLIDFQNVCELVFITCTGNRLIMSRGKDEFEPDKEQTVEIKWT
ncbi:MAG: hypothetical protein HQK89_04675 [Nitrospirae bacterium]|nr:hypothetical protein [Nitrospirota bacterium]